MCYSHRGSFNLIKRMVFFVAKSDNEKVAREKKAKSIRRSANKVVVEAILKDAMPGWVLVDDSSLPNDKMLDPNDELLVRVQNKNGSRVTTVVISRGCVIGGQG